MLGKARGSSVMLATHTVATGTPWERTWNLEDIADSGPPPRHRWLKRLRWAFKQWDRKRRRARIDREIAAYRLQIAREGYIPGVACKTG